MPEGAKQEAPAVAADTDDPEAPSVDRHIVAVGASAGGLKALQALVGGLPKNLQAPVVVVLHMDPDHPSGVASLLQRRTELKVKQAEDREPLENGCVYVCRPDHHLEVRSGEVHLNRSARLHFSRPSIDRLFASVGRAYGANAIAVVLSGSGSDGSAGVIDVKGRGGAVVTEAASTAVFAAMPEAAARTGCADAVLPVDDIPGFIVRTLAAEKLPMPDDHWQSLLQLLQRSFGTDFTAYRGTTLRRRLQRRLAATGDMDLGAYVHRVKNDPSELANLHAAFLIKVSSFMRDPPAWQDLKRVAIEPIIKSATADREIRAWSAGCATGEEAYSLAILLSEAAAGRPDLTIRVFATDISDDALATARNGYYGAPQLENLDPALRARYFSREGDGWRVTKTLRSRVIFGHHDVLQDPPFSSIDVLTCRNVLIYFSGKQKNAVLQRFTYALRPGGHMMLGKSEGTRGKILGCTRLSGPANLFRREDIRYVLPGRQPRAAPPAPSFEKAVAEARHDQEEHAAFQHLLVESASMIVFTVDAERRIQLWNRAAEVFFGTKAHSAMNHPLYEIVEAAPAERLSTAVKEALARRCMIQLKGLTCDAGGAHPRLLDLDIIPFSGKSSGHDLLFIGVDVTSRHEAEAEAHELLAQAQVAAGDAASANEALMASNEELETLNEELQTISEEQQSTNEELESRNEELETVNEELQSTNEELSTLNDEVRSTAEEADRLNVFLHAMMTAWPGAIIGCNPVGEVTLWSELASQRFLLSAAQAVGQRLEAVVPALGTPAMRQAVADAISGGADAPGVTLTNGREPLNVEVRAAVDPGGVLHGYFLIVRPA